MFTIVQAPFHLGLENVASGAGPRRILEAGADRILSTRGIPAQVVHTRNLGNATTDLDAIVDLNRQVRHAVIEASAQDSIPVVLAGDCNTSLGTLAGLDTSRLGVVWLTRVLDGMALAAALGLGHHELRERIGMQGFVAGRNVLLLGVVDLDPGEEERLALSGVTVRPQDRLADVSKLLDGLRRRVDSVYLHIDTEFSGPAGLVSGVLRTLPLAAVNLTNYNPDLDAEDRNLASALALLQTLAATAFR